MNEDFDNFDRDFDRMQKGFFVIWAFAVTIGLGLLGFFVWVVFRLLQFFGVV